MTHGGSCPTALAGAAALPSCRFRLLPAAGQRGFGITREAVSRVRSITSGVHGAPISLRPRSAAPTAGRTAGTTGRTPGRDRRQLAADAVPPDPAVPRHPTDGDHGEGQVVHCELVDDVQRHLRQVVCRPAQGVRGNSVPSVRLRVDHFGEGRNLPPADSLHIEPVEDAVEVLDAEGLRDGRGKAGAARLRPVRGESCTEPEEADGIGAPVVAHYRAAPAEVQVAPTGSAAVHERAGAGENDDAPLLLGGGKRGVNFVCRGIAFEVIGGQDRVAGSALR